MPLNLEAYFSAYEQVVKAADEAFRRVHSEFPDCVKCQPACDDCCYALFDLTLIEAIYINQRFQEQFQGEERAALLQAANEADRRVFRLKRDAFRKKEAGAPEAEILEEMGQMRVRCPMLNEEKHCSLYAYRPITCRLYGIPTAIGGVGRTCGMSGFQAGHAYPTVHIDAIHQKLYRISAQMVSDIGSRYARLGEVLVPLSMAILTEYDDHYLGVGEAAGDAPVPDEEENMP